MNALPEYSIWLDEAKIKVEEAAWESNKWLHERQYSIVRSCIEDFKINSIFEVGCGTGRLAKHIPDEISYMGFDINPGCISMARYRNPKKTFVNADIRRNTPTIDYDLAVSFAMFKHVRLEDWDRTLKRLLSCAKFTVISQPFADRDIDNGTEFTHVLITEERLRRVAEEAKCDVVWIQREKPEEEILFKRREQWV
jgi:trans-aconitate methyltransferase